MSVAMHEAAGPFDGKDEWPSVDAAPGLWAGQPAKRWAEHGAAFNTLGADRQGPTPVLTVGS